VNEKKVALLKRHIPFYYLFRHFKQLFSPKEFEYVLLSNNLNRYDVFIDVGANLGVYTFLFSRSAADVYALEPNPFLYEYLSAILKKKVKLINCAASSKSSVASLYIPSNELTSGRSSLVLENTKAYSGSLVEEKVSTILLTDLVACEEYNRIFVKIDVEGFEIDVISGCQGWFENECNVDFMIEIDSGHNKQWSKVFEFMKENHYKSYYFNGEKMVLMPELKGLYNLKLYQEWKGKRKKVDNFFFSREDLSTLSC